LTDKENGCIIDTSKQKQEHVMSWQLEGLCVEAMYLEDIPVSGRVMQSRVAYGGMVKHTILLQKPINLFGTVRDRVIIEHTQITRVMSNEQEIA
jgi:hypothetical protein